uniref:H-2 class II histocompatibility antigen, I-E beta chain-like n=1 Tax=Sinocyclocheilus rhinocerous TaxID=307959 RepID=A0A673L3M0_9TELE
LMNKVLQDSSSVGTVTVRENVTAEGLVFSSHTDAVCIHWSSDMVFVDNYIFNKDVYIQFNSTVGEYVGYTAHGVYNADLWNKDTNILQQERAEVDRYLHLAYVTVIDSVPPKVKLSSVTQAGGRHPAVLMCSAYRFYPHGIKVSWMRDGAVVKTDVTSTEEMPNGDWYYQIHSHLEYTPKSGEKISCAVDHAAPVITFTHARPILNTIHLSLSLRGIKS